MFDEPCSQAACFLAIYCRGARYLRQNQLACYSVSLAWYRTSMVEKGACSKGSLQILTERDVLSESKTRGHPACVPDMVVIGTKIGLHLVGFVHSSSTVRPISESRLKINLPSNGIDEPVREGSIHIFW
jgi:hypothetical protein